MAKRPTFSTWEMDRLCGASARVRGEIDVTAQTGGRDREAGQEGQVGHPFLPNPINLPPSHTFLWMGVGTL